MSVWSLVGFIVIGGFVLASIIYIFYYLILPLFKKFKLSKEVPRARIFLKQLNKRFPLEALSNEEKMERERVMIESGFSPQVISLAQSSKPNEVEELIEWFKEAIEVNGMSMYEAESLLIKNNWKQKTIDKAKKRLFKLNKGGVKIDGRKFPNTRGIPKNTRGIDSGTDRGGNTEIELKRLLPLQHSKSIERNKSKSEWNWKSFK